MAKKRFYNKTTKKQWIYLILELSDLIVLPFILLLLGIDDDIFMAVSMGVILTVGIVLCVLCVGDSRHNYKKFVADMERKQRILLDYKASMTHFDYDTSTIEQRVSYLIYCLYVTSKTASCQSFYENTYMFTQVEIGELLRGLVGYGLDDFVADTLLNKLDTKSIYKYEAFLQNHIYSKLGLEPKDTLLDDDYVLYDTTYHYRAYITQDSKRNYYIICDESFVTDEGVSWWDKREHRESKYGTYDLAYADMLRMFRVRCPIIDDTYYDTYPVDEDILRYNILWSKWTRGDLPQDIKYTCDYYSGVMSSGHSVFFQNNDCILEEILESLSRVLPQDLYDNVVRAYNLYTSHRDEVEYIEVDKVANDNESILRGILEDYARQNVNINRKVS